MFCNIAVEVFHALLVRGAMERMEDKGAVGSGEPKSNLLLDIGPGLSRREEW